MRASCVDKASVNKASVDKVPVQGALYKDVCASCVDVHCRKCYLRVL